MLISALLILVTPLSNALPREDEAHRLDRMQTRLLNERAAARLRPAEAVPTGPMPARDDALRQRAEQAIERWRADQGCTARECAKR